MAGPGILSFSRTEKYCTKLADEIMKLRGERALMDFTICVKDDEFPCAKFVMAIHSPMLRAVLTSDMAEVAKQEIRLDHMCKDIIQIILDYMYCEDVSYHKDHLMDLIAAADYLQMTELKEMCLSEVPDILEPGNVISWWKEAAKMNYDTIKEKCEEIMAANFKDLSEQTDFLNLDLNEMKHYVSSICSETVNSDTTVDATIRWVSHAEERIDLLEDLLHILQLSKCSEEGIQVIIRTHEALLDKTPMVYKLLLKTSANARNDESKTVTDSVVIVGGRDDKKAKTECWKINEDGLVHLYDILVDKIGINISVCMVPQGFVVTGGAESKMCIMFITSTRSWLRLQDMLTIRRSHGTAYVKQVLYVLGGYVGNYSSDSQPSKSVHFMAMERGNWIKGQGLPLGIKFPKLSNIDDRVYLLDENSSKLLCLDIDEKVWHPLAPLPSAGSCIGVSMTAAHKRLFVAGGLQMFCSWYNPETNTWCKGQQPLREHKYGALTYHRDKLVLLGGNFCQGAGTDDVEEYNIEEDKWSVCTYKMPPKLYLHHAVVLSM